MIQTNSTLLATPRFRIRTVLEKRVANKALISLVVDLFEAINDRIRFLYDRDHQIGHSYFLEVSDVEALRLTFVDRIIPMLQEYFYGAWDKICIVLGCPYSETGEPKRRENYLADTGSDGLRYTHPMIAARGFSEEKTLGFDHDDYEDRVDYRIRSSFQYGILSPEELYRTFIGVLVNEDAESFDKRLSELLPSETTVSDNPEVQN